MGQGAVAIFPTFKGFRKALTAEVDDSTREGGQRFTKGFSAAGTTAGKGFAEGFKKQAANVSADALKKATDEVAKATRELSAVRLKEQDALGKQRVAEAQLADARKRYADDSVQVVRAQERLASAQRQVLNVQESVENSTERLARAKRDLADASTAAANGGSGWGRVFGNFGGQAADGFGGGFRRRVGEIFTGNFLADVAFSVGQAALRGVVSGVQAGVQFGFEGIQLASDLAEATNAARVTFGDELGAQLESLAKDAPANLALTRRAFLQTATQFSAFARVVRRDNPVGFIDELTTRGADFASVYNLDVAEALQLFQSGLAGETEPLRRYGLNLSAAAVESFAYANGIAAAGRELTENEKVQARWGLLLEQTAAVQGDASNTSGELARQQRDLAVALEESQTKLGEYLIPGFLSLVTVANDQVLPVLGGIVDRVGPRLGAALEDVDWAGLASSIAPVLEDVIELGVDGLPDMIRGFEDFANEAPIWIERFQSIGAALEPIGGLLATAAADSAGFWALAGDIIGGDLLFADDTELNRLKFRAQEGLYGPLLEGLFDFSVDWDREWNRIFGIPDTYFGPGEFVPTESIDEGFRSGLRSTRSGLDAISDEFAEEAERNGRRGGGGAFDLGQSVGDGLEAGLNAARGRVGRAASNLANEVKKQTQLTLETNSPSKVAREFGQFYGDGLVLGMRDRQSSVATAASMLAGVIPVATSMNAGGAGGSSSSSSSSTTIQLMSPDPYAAAAMVMQELDERLRVNG
ncbi:hypothetical protein [Microcella frigidaquae]|uniref:hypothetical protein n=1 Tax=Microcella frigidaquae TaxID=424758 RepID=UPI001405518A|nr:hypothetical protein [Microcella frigidaquae]NHN45100.1 hypothetical protein [Microcella frigidaquae]